MRFLFLILILAAVLFSSIEAKGFRVLPITVNCKITKKVCKSVNGGPKVCTTTTQPCTVTTTP